MENLKNIMEIDKESFIKIISFYNYFMVKFDDILKVKWKFVNIIEIIIIYYKHLDLKVL